MLRILCISLFIALTAAQSFGPIPTSGEGTATIYDTSSYQHGVGACNCRTGIAKYPTAALSQFYFGAASGGGAGGSCGKCFKLTVVGDPYDANWCPPATSLVVKVADLCPAISPNLDWCAATASTNNKFGVKAHFDLDQTTASVFTNLGRGAFRVHYCQVPCSQWSGYNDAGAYGQQSSTWGSCPRDVAGTGSCAVTSKCGSSPSPAPAPTPAPTPAPQGGRPQIVWNKNSNEWWFAIRISPRPTTVSVNCGQGWVILGNPTWDYNSWEANAHCVGAFQLQINGKIYPASIFDNPQRYGDLEMSDMFADDENDDDENDKDKENDDDEDDSTNADQDDDFWNSWN